MGVCWEGESWRVPFSIMKTSNKGNATTHTNKTKLIYCTTSSNSAKLDHRPLTQPKPPLTDYRYLDTRKWSRFTTCCTMIIINPLLPTTNTATALNQNTLQQFTRTFNCSQSSRPVPIILNRGRSWQTHHGHKNCQSFPGGRYEIEGVCCVDNLSKMLSGMSWIVDSTVDTTYGVWKS